MHQHDSKVRAMHVVVASLAGLAAAGAVAGAWYRRRWICHSPVIVPEVGGDDRHVIVPRISRTESGRHNLESFSHFVARQLGFSDPNECPQLCKLAIEYLKKPKDCEEKIFDFFSKEEDVDSLYVMLIEEFERFILMYFAFHWSESSLMISQVLSEESEKKPKLKGVILAATRKQRFERVTKDLKVTRMFSTLVEEMKAIGGSLKKRESECNDVLVPAAHSQRSPVLLLMGGGMGAGKSTVLKDILKDPLWSEAAENAVVVEADAFKESDVIYKALSAMGQHNDMLQTAELVHQSSTDAASSLLVTALNEGRDVIMDGTLSWVPFVEQTIAMARNVHKHRYRMGAGYKIALDGTVTEDYWEQLSQDQEDGSSQTLKRKPYRIELVGVVCDVYLAVVRGIRRAIMINRAVRVNSQLKSHQRFASAFSQYCQLVDNAKLYSTNAVGAPPKLIGWKDGANSLLVDPEEIGCLNMISTLNSEAESIYELYEDRDSIFRPGSVWNDVVLSPLRKSQQQALTASVRQPYDHPSKRTWLRTILYS